MFLINASGGIFGVVFVAYITVLFWYFEEWLRKITRNVSHDTPWPRIQRHNSQIRTTYHR